MPSRTYVQMYVETGMYYYIVKNRSHYMQALSDAYQYLHNHPEKVEEVVTERVRVGKLTRLQRTPRTSFQWLLIEIQVINSWILDETFSGDTMALILEGLSMPNCCADCPCCDMEMVECKVTNEDLVDGIFELYAQRPSWCPLKEVKDGNT